MKTHALWAILLAAGQGSRLAHAAGGRKQFLRFHDAPLYWHSVRTLAALPVLRGIVVLFPPEELAWRASELDGLKKRFAPGLPILAAPGGVRRQDSVRNGLNALPADCGHVLVHDSARPFFSAILVQTLLDSLSPDVSSVIPATAVTDTIKVRSGDLAAHTLDRATLAAVQTPQLFCRTALLAAHERAAHENWQVTDDASMLELAGFKVRLAPGETGNVKITNPEDLHMLASPSRPPAICTGFGYDVHAYGGNRPLMLGGIPIAGAPQVRAHSDGDVLLHALCDAILGCLGLGDIGEHFPDQDARFDNIASGILLAEVMDKARQAGLTICHADLTVIAQTPRLTPHKAAIRANVAQLMELDPSRVNLKATTEEHLGFTGRKEGIKAVAVVTGVRRDEGALPPQTPPHGTKAP